jgi:hypothetical protein
MRRNFELLMKDFVRGLIAESFTRSIAESLNVEGRKVSVARRVGSLVNHAADFGLKVV